LTRIVLNACYRRLRNRRPTVNLEQIENIDTSTRLLAFPMRYSMDDPAQTATRTQMRELIEQAVTPLPDKFSVVFMLRDVEGCSTEETAAALGIRTETVKTRLFRARRRLRKELHDKLSASLDDAFPFLGARCARLTDSVMQRIEETENQATG